MLKSIGANHINCAEFHHNRKVLRLNLGKIFRMRSLRSYIVWPITEKKEFVAEVSQSLALLAQALHAFKIHMQYLIRA